MHFMICWLKVKSECDLADISCTRPGRPKGTVYFIPQPHYLLSSFMSLSKLIASP